MSLLDVAHEIKLDHDNVRDLYARFTAATAVDEKAAIANTMIREMAIHADAECAPPPRARTQTLTGTQGDLDLQRDGEDRARRQRRARPR
jgi:hypothetical protein